MSNCLLETSSTRKNKINLGDYNYQRDIQNRILLADLTEKEREVLEEILYSPLQFPLQKLAKTLDCSKEELMEVLLKLSPSGLFTLDKDLVLVDKESRKYFELQMQKFDEDFEPGMEFLQALLKKPPIHVLPIWYAISRTSDNIFDSIVEKNLLTPQLFQRYIAELNFGEPILKQIIQDVYNAEGFEIPTELLREKYHITRELFEEYMLHLEFSFACCVIYRKENDKWVEKVSPFHEWKEHLHFLRQAEISSIKDIDLVQVMDSREFAFVEDLTVLLEKIRQAPLAVTTGGKLLKNPTPLDSAYVHYLVQKLLIVRFAEVVEGSLLPTEASLQWLTLSLDRKALHLYRHPLNKILDASSQICTEKTMREAEKTVSRVVGKGWVFFDEFLVGVLAPLGQDSTVILKKTGKTWKYTLPDYSKEEKGFLRSVILEWMFEAGLTQVGALNEKECFRLTNLGQTLFAR